MSPTLPVESMVGAAPSSTDDETRRRILDLIDARGLRIVLQPIVHLDTGHVIGAEALTRFPADPAPGVWFADAARLGLGPALELAAAMVAVELLDDLPRGVHLSLNASVTTTAVPAFAALVEAAEPGRLVVELTFRTGSVTLDEIVGAVERVSSLGARVALDDVGGAELAVHDVVGVSPDIVKLDHRIVQAVEDPAGRSTAAGVVAAARELGAFTVAKGVETSGQLAALVELGVDAAQGHLLSAPAPPPLAVLSVALG